MVAAVPFASRADRERALSVMGPIIAEPGVSRQFGSVCSPAWHAESRPTGAAGRGPATPRRAYSVVVTDLRFTDEKAASRYALHRGDDLVSVLDYRDDGRSVAMTRAFTIPTFRGHGYAGELVERAVAHLEAQGDREVVPVCWYVAEWFESHPERAGILQQRRPV